MIRNMKIFKNKQVKNCVWLVFEQVFNMIISLIVSMLTSRYLGPKNFGTLKYVAALITFVTSIASLGMDSVIIKKLIENPKEENLYLGSCIGFRFISSIISSIFVFIFVYFFDGKDSIKLILVLIQTWQLILHSFQILEIWFQRYSISKYICIAKIIACLIVSIYKIYLLVNSKSIIWFAFSNVILEMTISLISYIFYRVKSKQRLKFSFSKGMEVLKESYHFIISGLMVAIYTQMDSIMISKFLSDYEVGLYNSAISICGMWLFIPMAILNSFKPKIIEYKKENEELYIRRLEQLYSCVIWISIIFSIFVTCFSKIIILILYGKKFIKANATLKIAVWFEVFSIIGCARSIWILCENKNKYVKYYLFIGAIINIVLNYFLIQNYGINGAAIATLITQFVTSIIAPLCFKATRPFTKIVLNSIFFYWKWGCNKNGKKS